MKNSNKWYGRLAEAAGLVLMTGSVVIALMTFWPLLAEEWRYQRSDQPSSARVVLQDESSSEIEPVESAISSEPAVVRPVDEEFGIVIPKIGANAAVVADVDWKDSAVYQRALTRGVAHAVGTAHPGESGNIFLFAHSGIDFYEAVRYNAVFYLINKLELGDEITLIYRKQKFIYRVTEQKIVASEDVEYITGHPDREALTLMTCWPAGTTLRRLVVVAERVNR